MEMDTENVKWVRCFQKTEGSNAFVHLWVNPVLYRLVQARNDPENRELLFYKRRLEKMVLFCFRKTKAEKTQLLFELHYSKTSNSVSHVG